MNSAPRETHSDGVGVAEGLRGQPDAEQAAEQQPDGREGAGDEALPVAGEGVGDDEEHQQPVEEVHRPGPSWNLVLGAGIVGGRRRGVAAEDHPVLELEGDLGVPVARPPEMVEQPGDDTGGEPPQQEVTPRTDQEPRAHPAHRVDVVTRWAGSSSSCSGTRSTAVDLVGVDHGDRRLLAPPAEHGGDREVARRQPQLGQGRRRRRRPTGRARSPPRPRAAPRRPRRRRWGRSSRRGTRPGRGGSACGGPAR